MTRIGSSAISATLAATGRLGKLLIDASEINRAPEVLEAASANRRRRPTRRRWRGSSRTSPAPTCGWVTAVESVEAADRALAIAERLNLDPVVAEAFVNKGSALDQLGRRREAIALDEAALDMAKALPTATSRCASGTTSRRPSATTIRQARRR